MPRLSARQLREQTAPVNAGAAAEAAGANTLVSVKTAAESGRGTAKAGGKVHLNTATAAELTALPGVGDITAQRILEYRAAHGFASIEDVMKVKGIGKAKFMQNGSIIWSCDAASAGTDHCRRHTGISAWLPRRAQ